jgi:hypothetical protein
MLGRHGDIVVVGVVVALGVFAGVSSCGSSDQNQPSPSEMEGGCGPAPCTDAGVADAVEEDRADTAEADAEAEGRVDADSAEADAQAEAEAEAEGGVDAAIADAEAQAEGSEAGGDAPIDAAASVDACADGGCATCALEAGLVGYWKLDDGSGTVAVDSSGSGNPGTLVNAPTWTTAAPTPYPNASALTFDGVNSFVTMGNPTALRITGPLTVACWFKTSSILGNYRMLVSKWWSGEIDAAYSLFFSNAGLEFSLFNGTTNLSTTVNLVFNDDTWHAVVGTWDGSTARTYFDGVLRDSVTNATFGALADIAHPVNIGTDDRYPPGTGDRFFPGSIDDVRIYNRALSAAEVGALFKGTCSPL